MLICVLNPDLICQSLLLIQISSLIRVSTISERKHQKSVIVDFDDSSIFATISVKIMPRYRVLEDSSSINDNSISIPTTSSSDYEQLDTGSPVLCTQDVEFVTSHISFLYVNKRLPALFDFMWNLSSEIYFQLPRDSKVILAKCLFRLGRTDSARRRLSALVEIENDFDKRRALLWIMLKWCKIMGWHAMSNTCKGDLIHLEVSEAYKYRLEGGNTATKNDHTEIIIQKIQDLTAKEYVSARKKDNYRTTLLIIEYSLKEYEFTSMSIITQIENALKCGCALPHKSFGRICYTASSCADRSLKFLAKSTSKRQYMAGSRWCDPLGSIFESISFLPCVPRNLFINLLKHQDTIKNYIETERQMLSIDRSLSVSEFLESLSHLSMGGNSSFYLCEVVSRHLLILGFLDFVQNECERAIAYLNWLFEFLSELGSRFRNNLVANKYLGIQTYVICHILLFELTIKALEEILPEEYQGYCLHFLQHAEMVYETHTTYFDGNYGPTLNAFAGLCCERRASLLSERVTLIYTDEQTSDARKYHFEELIAAASNYIITAVNKPNDDPTIIDFLDRVIWCILLCGGLHLKCLQYFISIRTYFTNKFDFGPFHIFSDYPYQIIPGEDMMKHRHNGWEVANRLYRLWEDGLLEDDKTNCWTSERSRHLLMPQFFDTGVFLVQMEDDYYEVFYSSFEGKKFVVLSELQCKPLLKSQIRIPENVIQDRVTKSMELLKIWEKLYCGEKILGLESQLDYPD